MASYVLFIWPQEVEGLLATTLGGIYLLAAQVVGTLLFTIIALPYMVGKRAVAQAEQWPRHAHVHLRWLQLLPQAAGFGVLPCR